MSGHVFVSYSHDDSTYVDELVAYLRSAGMDVWTDEGIDYGSRWPEVIEAKIDTREVFVPIMSTSSRQAARCSSVWSRLSMKT